MHESMICKGYDEQRERRTQGVLSLLIRNTGAGRPIKTERSLHNMDEEFKVIDNYLMIRLPNEIDHHKSVDISAKADRYIVSKKVGNVVFDFERTTFMDSSGIGIILGRYKKISCFGGRVYAVNVDSRIRRILLLSGLENIVEIME